MPRFGNIGTEAKAELDQHKTAMPAHSVEQITDAVDKKGSTMTGALYLSGNPTQDTQAATKLYVDASRQGLSLKYPCRVATTTNILLNGLQTVDGVALAIGNRVLVKDQTNALQNGIYTAQTGDWIRAIDSDNTPGGEVMSGMFTFISEGTINKSAGFTLATPDPVNLGTTPLYFIQFSGAGEITVTSDLTKSGNQLGLSTTGVAAGTYPKVTVDAKGRVTGGAALLATDIPSLDWSKITTGKPTTLVGYGIAATDTLLTTNFAPTGYGLGVQHITRASYKSSTDLNTLMTTGFFYSEDTCSNKPVSVSGFLTVQALNNTYITQEYVASNTGIHYERSCVNGVWGVWKSTVTSDQLTAKVPDGIQFRNNVGTLQYSLDNGATWKTVPLT